MLSPLLFLWPISVAVTHHFANQIANQPYDETLAENVRAIAKLVRLIDGNVVRRSACFGAYFAARRGRGHYLFSGDWSSRRIGCRRSEHSSRSASGAGRSGDGAASQRRHQRRGNPRRLPVRHAEIRSESDEYWYWCRLPRQTENVSNLATLIISGSSCRNSPSFRWR